MTTAHAFAMPPPPPPPPAPPPAHRHHEIPDELSYQRFRERVRTDYAHLVVEDRVYNAARDLADLGNTYYACGDLDAVGRLHYCFSCLEQDWAAYLARERAAS